jgi:hypothetical protein
VIPDWPDWWIEAGNMCRCGMDGNMRLRCSRKPMGTMNDLDQRWVFLLEWA